VLVFGEQLDEHFALLCFAGFALLLYMLCYAMPCHAKASNGFVYISFGVEVEGSQTKSEDEAVEIRIGK
jgi:hypothetical protein